MRYKGIWLLVIALLASAGCKKPEIEVEEEGPPLPLPTAGTAPGEGAPGQPSPENVGAPSPDLPLDQETACQLMDTHMRMLGFDLTGRECSNLRLQRESIRLNRYYIYESGGQGTFHSYNACLWRSDSGEDWEIGYIDQVVGDCQARDDYCKLGVEAAKPLMSFRACPGERDHYLAVKEAAIERLVGVWVPQNKERNERLRILPQGGFSHSTRNHTTEGQFDLVSATVLELSTAGTGHAIRFARVGDTLYMGIHGGLVAPAKDPESFSLRVSPALTIRRFRGACYEISTPPKEFPTPITCEIQGEEENRQISFQTESGRFFRLSRVGDYWMDQDLMRQAFIQEGSREQEETASAEPDEPESGETEDANPTSETESEAVEDGDEAQGAEENQATQEAQDGEETPAQEDAQDGEETPETEAAPDSSVEPENSDNTTLTEENETEAAADAAAENEPNDRPHTDTTEAPVDDTGAQEGSPVAPPSTGDDTNATPPPSPAEPSAQAAPPEESETTEAATPEEGPETPKGP